DVRYTTENPPKDLFNNGRAALYLSGNWEAALLQESPVREHLGVAPIIHGAQEANVIHGIGCAMSSRSRHKPAASAFLAFLGSEEANRIQAEAGAANPAFVGTNDAYVDAIPEFSLDVFVDAAETAQPYPASQNTSAWLQLEELLFPKILGGDAPLEQEARELADRMNGVLAAETRQRACRDGLWPVVFLAPLMIGVAVFYFWPILATFLNTFASFDPFGGRSFAGLENYRTLLGDSFIPRAVLNTAVYTAIVLLGIPIAVGI